VTARRTCAVEELRDVQEELRPLEGKRLTGARRSELWRRQWRLAVELSEQLSWPEAKELQLEASDGRPFTICYGHFGRTIAHAVRGSVDLSYRHGDGCGLVFLDSTSTRGSHPFDCYCRECRRRATDRKRKARSRTLAHNASFEEVVVGYAENGSAILAWSGECSVCGETFIASRIDARRCDRCRRAHRWWKDRRKIPRSTFGRSSSSSIRICTGTVSASINHAGESTTAVLLVFGPDHEEVEGIQLRLTAALLDFIRWQQTEGPPPRA